MSLATNVSNLATRVATEVKAIRTLVNGNAADLASLDTTAKANLVAAINELKGDLSTLAGDLSSFETATGSDISALQGDLATLESSLSALQTAFDNLDVSAQVNALIDDTATGTSTVWSSSKTDSAISAAVSALVDGAPALLDTLNELAAAIGDDSNFVTTVTNMVASKADDSAVVKLTGDQTVAGVKTFSSAPVVPDAAFAIAKVNGLTAALAAKANASDVGDTTTNFVTAFEAGLV